MDDHAAGANKRLDEFNICSNMDIINDRIKRKLQDDGIKLWLEPFFLNGESVAEEITKFADVISNDLQIEKNLCTSIIRELQEKSLQNIKDGTKFTETGVATLKVKFAGGLKSGHTVQFQTKLSAKVKDFHSLVESTPGSKNFKLIFRGRVLAEDQFLETQGVKNGSQLLCLVTSGVRELKQDENNQNVVCGTSSDLDILTDRKYGAQMLTIENQSGQAIELPESERIALIRAMAFHEKGRSTLKTGNFSLALVFLLEADKEFTSCNADILTAVDNYGLLNLDIVWCYFRLDAVNFLPDAESRLRKCEEYFGKSYGEQLQRLTVVKGTTGNEAALFMRLHLLQGVVLFHQNKVDLAKQKLLVAAEELNRLKDQDKYLPNMLDLGYSAEESRLGLRATGGNPNAAIEYIERTREERDKKRREYQRKLELEKQMRMGMCADGVSYVNLNYYNNLRRRFKKDESREALKQTNNDLAMSNELLNDPVRRLLLNESLNPNTSQDQNSVAKSNENQHQESSSDESKLTEEGHRRKKLKNEAYRRFADDLNFAKDDFLNITLEEEETYLMRYQSLLPY